MLNFISVELSKYGRFNTSDSGFFDTGHTKTMVDQTFAVRSNELAKADTYNITYFRSNKMYYLGVCILILQWLYRKNFNFAMVVEKKLI